MYWGYFPEEKKPYLKYDIIIECKNLNPVKLSKKQINLYNKICELKDKFILDDPKKIFKIWENNFKKLYRYDLTDDRDLDYLILMIKQKFDSI